MLGDLWYRYRRHRERNMSPESRLKRDIKREVAQAKKLEQDFKKLLKKTTKKSEKVAKMLRRQTPRTRRRYDFKVSFMIEELDFVKKKKNREIKLPAYPSTRQLMDELKHILKKLKGYEKKLAEKQISHFDYMSQCYGEFKIRRAEQQEIKQRRREEQARKREADARLSSRFPLH